MEEVGWCIQSRPGICKPQSSVLAVNSAFVFKIYMGWGGTGWVGVA
jgi:hypothetical protein